MNKMLFLFILIIGSACNQVVLVNSAIPLIEEPTSTIKAEEAAIDINKALHPGSAADVGEVGVEVDLYKELIWIFDPDNFNCGLDDKLKDKLRKIKAKNKSTEGFVPEDVINGAYLDSLAIFYNRAGSNLLVHSFKVEQKDGTLSKYLFARNAETSKIYDVSKYFITTSGVVSNFVYTCDCSGFLSAGVAASAKFGLFGGTAALRTSAESAASTQKSLVVMAGVIITPLMAAYLGTDMFESETDTAIIKKRIQVLESILKASPSTIEDAKKVDIRTNYIAVFASNQGEKGFNGKATLEASSGFTFGIGGADANGQAKGEVSRTSKLADYRTYIVGEDWRAPNQDITIGKIKTLITNLKAKLKPVTLVASNTKKLG